MPKPRKPKTSKAPIEGELTPKDLEDIAGGLTLVRTPIPVLPQLILMPIVPELVSTNLESGTSSMASVMAS